MTKRKGQRIPIDWHQNKRFAVKQRNVFGGLQKIPDIGSFPPAIESHLNKITTALKMEIQQAIVASQSKETGLKPTALGELFLKRYSSQLRKKRRNYMQAPIAHGLPTMSNIGGFRIDYQQPLKTDILLKRYLLDEEFNEALQDWLDEITPQEFPDDGPEISNENIVVNQGVNLVLEYIKCLDETDPETRWSEDEIAFGGSVSLIPNVGEGTVEEISEFNVGKFKDGVKKSWSGGQKVANLDLTSKDSFPITITAFLTIAEKDSEGFAEFINDMYELIMDKISSILGMGGVENFSRRLGNCFENDRRSCYRFGCRRCNRFSYRTRVWYGYWNANRLNRGSYFGATNPMDC